MLLLNLFYEKVSAARFNRRKIDANVEKITKMTHIIIDGYNMIRQIPSLVEHEHVSLENGRKNLIGLLARYKRIKHHAVTVVFDGASEISEFAPAGKEMGIAVRYSPKGISADNVIADLARKERTRAVIVSSDNSVIQSAAAAGCGTMTAPDFFDRLLVAAFLDTVGAEKDETDRQSRQIHKRWATKKRGNPRRLPKKERRNSLVMKKI